MLIAQTGLIPSPLLDIQPGDGATSFSLWWLVPIAFIAVGISWYIRVQAKRNEQKTRPMRAPTTKMSESKTSNARKIADRETIGAANLVAPAVVTTKKTGKSKKRDRRRSEQSTKSVVSLPRSVPDAPSIRASVLTANPSTATTPSVPSSIPQSKSSVESPQQTPVHAIFEPLRDVSQHRRGPTFAPPIASSQSDDAVALNPPSSGKFERTVAPAAASRLVSNRWPSSASQPVKITAIATPRPKELLPPNPEINPVPVPAQATGLKSFVTKVKSSVSTSTDPAT